MNTEARGGKSTMEPFGIQMDLVAGVMQGSEECIARRASDMRGYYANAADLERLIREQHDPVHYETFESPVPEEYGQIKFCISKLYPGLVGDEYFMTKGHYHTTVEAAEIYLCLRGRGVMLMKTATGSCQWQEFQPGRLVYVPPYWAHRSINTGDEPLISLCMYPGDAGHNYGDIRDEGFPKRVVKRDGGVAVL